ncbi:serine palmitoyltransferase component [Gaertneriomyces sp. JEL0708]|nr:serine palmitoyltransferase component [Gaertneriomyces sp. JEL0708]
MTSTYHSYAAPFVNDAARDIADSLVVAVNSTFTVAVRVYDAIPGSRWFAKYVQISYQNDPYRTLLEIGLVIFMIWYFGGKKHKPGSHEVKLTEQEIQELIDEWEPEPLVPELTRTQRLELEKLPIISGPAGPKLKLADGKERLNLASFNFLGAMNDEVTKEKAIKALRKYGVGSCGPCGFYGTIDVHMELEKEVAKFLGTEAAIVYSQGFSTIASVIPAFAKRGDIVVADAGVSLAVQKGLHVSRSIVKYFKHNDMEDLERVLEQINKEQIKKKKPLTRRFIVVEGIYANHGDICPLPQLVELKERHKYRLIVEESFSFGTVGDRGAGVCNHFDVDPKRVDIIAATFSNAIASAGGFCAGTKEIVEHQRLGGLSYVFSASLPAMLAVAAIEGVKYIESHGDALKKLWENIATMRNALRKTVQQISLEGDDKSPIAHLRLKSSFANRDEEEYALQEIVDECARNGVLVTRAKYVLDQEMGVPTPSIRLAISAAHTRKEVEKAASVIASAVKKILSTARK